MCGQAGCGACVVTAYVPKSNSEKGYEAISINSVRFYESWGFHVFPVSIF